MRVENLETSFQPSLYQQSYCFRSSKELSKSGRFSFIEFIRDTTAGGFGWQKDFIVNETALPADISIYPPPDRGFLCSRRECKWQFFFVELHSHKTLISSYCTVKLREKNIVIRSISIPLHVVRFFELVLPSIYFLQGGNYHDISSTICLAPKLVSPLM
ncbi:hypothetical protein TNIN_340141 [Trichonephila inaurata madagascariensis]|uniref:Uncharacterized protein n=1 Tax=Trichonephila inaurata madagascariensis TaxID=2747483 RepID=A0A8X6WTJ0_9ARAC|nr:hypothetical protein TNIN_340141 [Trichonephila inaurata madagascariensis]